MKSTILFLLIFSLSISGQYGNKPIKGTEDLNNSTSIVLLGDSIFTGIKTNILGFEIIFINIYADVASATDGLVIQQSSNGINWDHDDVYTVPAGGSKNYSINPYAKWLRIIYTNGSLAQTAFRLQTILKGNSKPSSHRIQDMIVDDDDAELVKAVLTAKNASGNFINIDADNFDNLKTVVQRLGASISSNSSSQLNVTQFLSNGEEAGRILDPSLEIARGNIIGHSTVHKFGNAPDFDTGDNEITIWDGADDGTAWENMNYTWSVSANIDSMSSSNAGDNQIIEIQGLKNDSLLCIQTITLNGQTPVALDTSLIRIFRAKNINSVNLLGHVFIYAGNDGVNSGIPNEADSIRALIIPENNQTEMAIYTVPNDETAYMRSWYAGTAGASKTSNYIIRIYARSSGQVFQLKHRSSISDNGTSYIQHKYIDPPKYDVFTDLIMTVQMTAAGGTAASVAGGFDIVLVDN